MAVQEYYSCMYIQDGIGFSTENKITVCCKYVYPELLITTFDALDDKLTGLENLILEKKEKIITDFKNGTIYECCKNCHHLKKEKYDDARYKKITHFSLNHYTKCNLRCVFCVHEKNAFYYTKDTKHTYILEALKRLHRLNYLHEDFFIGVGGGEPSLSRGIEQIIEYVVQLGKHVHINTNAAKFSKVFASGAKTGNIALLISADAGSREVYKKIKGADFFNKVWENIKKYMAVSQENIEVKFILQPANCDDIENIIEMCLKNNVMNVVLCMDAYIKQADHYLYLEPIQKFYSLCSNNKLQLKRGAFLPESLWNQALSLIPATLENFNEQGYLQANLDVAQAVKNKQIENGYAHFTASGHTENRRQFAYNKKMQEQTQLLVENLLHANNCVKLHIGCGTVYKDGWVNIDNNSDNNIAKLDLNWDLRNPLPFPDNSVDFIFNEHFLEHLTVEEGQAALRDFLRVLKPSGIMRIAMPNLEKTIYAYFDKNWKENNKEFFKKFGLEFIETRAERLNISFRWWGHKWLYDWEELERRLKQAGCTDIKNVEIFKSDHPELVNLETRNESTLIAEVKKL